MASETYDRLVVVKGPQTVLWGPGASAGTVRFERDTPRFDAPGLRVDGSLLGGSHGRNDQVLDATAGASRGYARLSANRSEADDYEDGDGRRVPSAKAQAAIGGRLYVTPDDIQALAVPTLAHRVLLSHEGHLSRRDVTEVIRGIVADVPVPQRRA